MSRNSILYTEFCFIVALTSMGSVRLWVRWRRLCSVLTWHTRTHARLTALFTPLKFRPDGTIQICLLLLLFPPAQCSPTFTYYAIRGAVLMCARNMHGWIVWKWSKKKNKSLSARNNFLIIIRLLKIISARVYVLTWHTHTHTCLTALFRL